MRKLLRQCFHVEHAFVAILAAVLLGLLAFVTLNISFLNPLARAVKDFSISDIYYKVKWMSEPDTSRMVTLVDITPLYDRGAIAEVLLDVADCAPAVTGVDVIFDKHKNDPEGEALLTEVVASTPGLVFADKLTDFRSSSGAFHDRVRSFFAGEVPVVEGYANVGDEDPFSRLRSLSVQRNFRADTVLSFSARLASAYRGEPIPSTFRQDRLINYRALEFPVVPADSVRDYRHLLEGRIVIVGALDDEPDMHITPLGKMAGMKVQAYATQTLLEQKNIVCIPYAWQIIVSSLFCYVSVLFYFFALGWISRRRSPLAVFLHTSRWYLRLACLFWANLFVFLTILCYDVFDTYVPMTVTLLLVVLVPEARLLYMSFVKACEGRRPARLFSRSLYKS